jgi:outer membrane protein insertion porin family
LVRTRAALLASVSLISVRHAPASLALGRVVLACALLATSGGPGFAQTAAGPAAPPAPAVRPAAAPRPATPARPGRPAPAPGNAITDIKVVGNERIEPGTIRSYMLLQPGDPFDPDRMDRSLKTLYATGLFSDVKLQRDGSTLVVTVAENPIVNRIAFEGNHKLTDEQLRTGLQLRPRAVYTAAQVQADRQHILDQYAAHARFNARVEPKIIRLDQNRVDVVFEIDDGEGTFISRIAFVGNKAYSEGRLREVISSRENTWWRFLSTSDTYEPDRVNYDKELLRRFYLRKGYADFQVTTSASELAADKSSFFVTFTLNEGERYTVGNTSVNSTLKGLDSETLAPLLELEPGDWYDGDAVERTTQALTNTAQSRGYAFVEVKPRISRDKAKHTVDLVFDVVEGPRVYVERIDINGNTRTKDKVIRREFRLAEGDPLNAALVRRSRQRLQDLDYFSNVQISSSPGSAPDRGILTTSVQEKATGELTIGGGYSTDSGALASAGLRERNLIGTGIDAGINGVLAQKRSELDLSVTDPYFLDRNLVTGFDLFMVQNNNQDIAQYNERRAGTSLRLGYEFTEHLRQVWTYSLVQRSVYGVQSGASIYVQDEAGSSLLSQLGQTLTLDYRDSRLDPHSGSVLRLGTDYAGLGGDAKFLRTKLDASYYIPLERYFGSPDWVLALSAGAGYLFNFDRQEKIIDRFFLGGDNLRGFQSGGAGPHAIIGGDSLGGRFIYTQSTELRFPLPVSADLGLTGRAFVDVGSLSEVNSLTLNGVHFAVADDPGPRVSAGVGVSWKTPFGLINIDLAQPIIKKRFDQTQLFRFGFGTRF